MQDNPLIRIQYLIGEEKLEKIKQSHICVFGCGGVGSFVVEGLIRTGVKEITLVDFDRIDISNLNRQLMTTSNNIGELKVEELSKRILSIHNDVKIHTYPIFFDHQSSLDFTSFDYVVDAIDSVNSKLEIMRQCEQHNVPLIMALGTGRKLDPTKLCVSNLYHTSICPLAKKVRILAKKEGLKNIKVVYSKEDAQDAYYNEETNKVIVGSMIFVPASAGLLLASVVIQDLCQDNVIIKKSQKG
jgi:tRNA A37 threonylcarbamoyladenosine dehydratase